MEAPFLKRCLPIEQHGHGHSEWVLGAPSAANLLICVVVTVVDGLADGGQVVELGVKMAVRQRLLGSGQIKCRQRHLAKFFVPSI